MRYEPLPKQREAYEYLRDPRTKFVLYGGAAGGGKSWLGCEWLLLCCHYMPGSRWFLGRVDLKKTRQSAVVTWTKVCGFHEFSDYTMGPDSIRFNNGSEIVFLELDFYPQRDPMFERFGSLEFTGGWIEEGGEVTGKAFEVLKTRVGRHLNTEYSVPPKILVTCNPKKNWLYQDFYIPWKEGRLSEDSIFIPALPGDNPYLTEHYIASLESLKDPVLRARLLLGKWEYEDLDNSLTTYAAIRDTLTNSFVVPDTGDKWITADIALEGSDALVVGVWYGWVLVEVRIMDKAQGPQVVGLIEGIKLKHGIPNSRIVYDDDGVGAFVGGFVKGSIGFNNGGAIQNGENYMNLKSQCYYKLADKINEGGIYLRALAGDTDLEKMVTEEFEQQLRSKDPDREGKLSIAPKKAVKATLGRSPDIADMIMMRLFPTVRRETSGRRSSFA